MDRDWNSWDDKPRTIEEHIEMYRENLVKIQEPEPVPEVEKIDLFEVCETPRDSLWRRFHEYYFVGHDPEDPKAKSLPPSWISRTDEFFSAWGFSDCRNSHNRELPWNYTFELIMKFVVTFRMSSRTGTKAISRRDGMRSTIRTRNNWFERRERKSELRSINRSRLDRISGPSMINSFMLNPAIVGLYGEHL